MESGKVADCGQIRKEKSENRRIWGEGRRVRKRINGVGESRLRTDLQEKERKWEVMG